MTPRQWLTLAGLGTANLGVLALLAVLVWRATALSAPAPAALVTPFVPPAHTSAPTAVGPGPDPSPSTTAEPAPTARALVIHEAARPVASETPALILETVPTAPPADLPPSVPPPLPDTAAVEGVVGHRQSLPLSCESRSAADWAAFFSVAINELEFLNSLDTSDDPDRGFVGDVRGAWGQLPPNPYGVHAGPVARLLNAYGLRAEPRRYMDWDDLRAEIAAGRPAIVWVVGHVEDGEADLYTAADGRQTIVARYEHTVIVTGYTPDSVTVVDGARTYSVSLDQFLRSWGVLRNMAVTMRP